MNRGVLKKADEALRSDLIFTPVTAMDEKSPELSGRKNRLVIALLCLLIVLLAGDIVYTGYLHKYVLRTANSTPPVDSSSGPAVVRPIPQSSVAKTAVTEPGNVQPTSSGEEAVDKVVQAASPPERNIAADSGKRPDSNVD